MPENSYCYNNTPKVQVFFPGVCLCVCVCVWVFVCVFVCVCVVFVLAGAVFSKFVVVKSASESESVISLNDCFRLRS